MKYVWRIVVLMLCTLLLCSCADSVEDGVLIVPSSRNLYEETSAVVTASAETEDVVPQTESFTAERISSLAQSLVDTPSLMRIKNHVALKRYIELYFVKLVKNLP
jgi:hypothetical protein